MVLVFAMFVFQGACSLIENLSKASESLCRGVRQRCRPPRRKARLTAGPPAHRPALPARRCRHPGRDPGGQSTLMHQVPDHARPLSGSRPPPSLLASPWARPPVTRAQPAFYAALAPVTRRSGSSIRGEVCLPRRQQETQARHVPLCLHLPALRPRQPGLLPAQT